MKRENFYPPEVCTRKRVDEKCEMARGQRNLKFLIRATGRNHTNKSEPVVRILFLKPKSQASKQIILGKRERISDIVCVSELASLLVWFVVEIFFLFTKDKN